MKLRKCACIEPMYSELPFLDRIQVARDDGFAAVEFWGWTDKNLEETRKAAEQAGIAISGFNGDADYSMIDPHHHDKYLEFLRQSIDAAKKLGASSVTIHSNALGADGHVIHNYQELSYTVKLCSMFRILQECADLAEHSGIMMYLEPLNIITDHVGNFLTSTQMAAEMTRLIGCEKLKVLYDVYHMQLNEGKLCDTIKTYIDQIGHIHIADVPGRHEPDTGEINFRKVFELLQQLGYDGYVGYELYPFTSTRNAVQAIMKYGG